MIPLCLNGLLIKGRILLTHDVATITRYAYERLANNLAMPGVIEIHTDAPIGRVIEDLFMILECGYSRRLGWSNLLRFLCE